MKTSRNAAFTLVETLIATGIFGVLGLVLYALSSEALTSFSRNVSINKSYTDARQALDLIGQQIQAAGHTPILTDANGLATANSPAAGLRFYTYETNPQYKISGSLSMSSSQIKADLTSNPTVPSKGNVVYIAGLGFQGAISADPAVSGNTATLTFASNLTSLCKTTAGMTTSDVPTTFLLFKPVSYAVVNSQLRYYPTAMQAAVDGAATYNDPQNYQILANMVTTPISTVPEQSQPFSTDSSTSTIQVKICAQAPDYANRANIATGGNTYSRMQSSFGSRCPILLRGPF